MENEKADGRLKRSERSRQAIIDSMISLMEQGCYIPTAQQVADKANISIRTVFRHFSEMEDLYKELDEEMKAGYIAHFVIQDTSGSVSERVARTVKSRLAGYIKIFHLEKATHTMLWRSPHIRSAYEGNQALLRKALFQMLPELNELPDESVELTDAYTSFEFFERLYTHQSLPIEKCESLITKKVIELFD